MYRLLPSYTYANLLNVIIKLTIIRTKNLYKGYPKGLLANEIQLDLNGTKKRCDTVLYNKDLSAKLIVEYKAPHIEITQTVFDQITRYNMVLKVDYLIVSNGLNHYCCHIDYNTKTYLFLPEIPHYSEL